MTVMEVYEWAMKEARYHREESEALLAKWKDVDGSNHQIGLAQAFYQVAGKLELTEEINPSK